MEQSKYKSQQNMVSVSVEAPIWGKVKALAAKRKQPLYECVRHLLALGLNLAERGADE